MEQEETQPDLELKHLPYYVGTQCYYNVLGVKVTEGVKYIMDNGYAWFVTDTLAVIVCSPKLRAEPFLSVKLKVKDQEADLSIEDGNDNAFYHQHYDFTDAKKDLTLFYEYGVLLLASEH